MKQYWRNQRGLLAVESVIIGLVIAAIAGFGVSGTSAQGGSQSSSIDGAAATAFVQTFYNEYVQARQAQMRDAANNSSLSRAIVTNNASNDFVARYSRATDNDLVMCSTANPVSAKVVSKHANRDSTTLTVEVRVAGGATSPRVQVTKAGSSYQISSISCH